MKLPPISSYAPGFTSHPADVRTQHAVTQALVPAHSNASDRVEQFIQAGFAKATALLDQITSSDKPPTLDQLTRYINALTRLATVRNVASPAPTTAPKPAPIQSPLTSIPLTSPAPQPVPPSNHTPVAATRQSSISAPHQPAAKSTSQPPALAQNPISEALSSSVASEPSVVEIPLPSHPHLGLYRPKQTKTRYKMVLDGTRSEL